MKYYLLLIATILVVGTGCNTLSERKEKLETHGVKRLSPLNVSIYIYEYEGCIYLAQNWHGGIVHHAKCTNHHE